MPIPAAAGYPQYSNSLITPLFSDQLIARFYCNTIFSEIANTDFIGELSNRGDTIHFFREPEVIVRDHVKDGTIKHDTLEAERFVLEIDRAKEFSIKIAKVDEKQIHSPTFDRWRTAMMQNAARKMQEIMDKELLEEMYLNVDPANQGANAGIIGQNYDLGEAGAPVAITSANVIEYLTYVMAVLDEQCIPAEGRFIVIPPVMKTVLLNSELRLAYATGMSQSPMLNGRIPGVIEGFNIFVSNFVPNVFDTGVNAQAFHIMAGYRGASVFATQLEETRMMEDKDSWDHYYQGLQVYGFGTVQPKGLARLYARFN